MTSKTARSPLDLFAAAVGLLLPLAYAPGLEGEAWSGRSIILLFVVAVGLPLLVRRSRGPKPLAARCAIAFLLVGGASTVLSQNRTTAVFGLYNQGTGLLFMASLAAAWAIGRSLSPEGRRLLELALLVGILVNIALAVAGPLVSLPSSLATVDPSGRSQALAGNPVHLSALALLGLALVVARFPSAPPLWALPVAATAAAVQLSGTRLALVVMLAIVLWAGRRHGIRIAAVLAVLVVLGLAAGTAVAPSGAGSATQRAAGTNDWRTRPATWLSARHAIDRHPLLGVGPGQFRTATSPYRPVSVALAEGSDKLFSDAHNLFVEYATTTGILGVAAFALWLVAAIRPARGWLLVGALAVVAIHMAEPQSVITTPLAFLALGAAAGTDAVSSTSKTAIARRAIAASLLAVAFLGAGVFLLGVFDLAQAQLDLRGAPADQANRILPAWPRTASLLARISLFEAITGHQQGSDYRQSRAWRVTAVHRDRADPALWLDLAEYDEGQGRTADALTEYLAALRLNPTSARSMDGLARLAQAACDAHQAASWHAQSLRVAPKSPGAPALSPPTGQPRPTCPAQHA